MDRGRQEGEKNYWAFVSYSSKDRKWGKWLHNRLENHPIPSEFQNAKLADGTRLGKNLRPCFRDRDELSGSSDLGPSIQRALENTRYLIVLCSPNSARSEWVNKEILDFREMKGRGNILALILEGEPNATSNPAIPDELECFPPALRYPEEPLAGDLRREGDGKERGFLKVLSGVAQLDFDVLYRRHERDQRKKRITLATVATAVIVSLSGLSTFAFQQKNEAQHQTRVAKERESEAAYERDQARKTLARFYTERALSGDNPFESLSWLVKACGIDPAVFSNPHVSNRAADWLGPWPPPDLCLGTGVKTKTSMDRTSDFTAHSRRSGKSVVQTGPRSWDLIDWKSRSRVGSFEFGEPIETIHHREEEDYFILLGHTGLEIRSWDDGRSLYRHSDSTSGPVIAPVAGGIFVSVFDYKTKTTRLSFISREEGNFTEREVRKMEGAYDRPCGSVSNDGRPSVFVLREKEGDAPQNMYGFIQKEPQGEWTEMELDLPAEFSPLYFYRIAGLPDDRLLIAQTGEKPTMLFNPDDSSFIPLSSEGSYAGFSREEATGNIQPIVITWLEDGRGSETHLRFLDTREDVVLLSGQNLNHPTYCKMDNAIAAWDEEKKELVYRRLDSMAVTFPLDAPLGWPQFYVNEISEVEPQLLLIKAYTGNRTLIFLADLSAESGDVFHFGSAPSFDTCLDAVRSENGYSMTALTHGGRSVSYFDKLLTIPQALANEPTELWQAPGKIGWLGVTDEGKQTALVTRKETDLREIALVFPECGKPSWLKSSWTGSDTMRSSEMENALPGGGITVSSYGEIQYIDSEGKPVLDLKSDFSATIPGSEGYGLLSQIDGKLSLSNLTDNKSRWSVPFPERIQGINGSYQKDRILILSSDQSTGFGGEPATFSLTLSTFDPSNGTRTEATFEQTGAETEKFQGYGSFYQLLPGDVAHVLVVLAPEGGVSEGIILEPSGTDLRETLRWQIDASGYSDACIPLTDGSFITRQLLPGEPVGRLSHHLKQDGKWISHNLPVPAVNDSIRIFPNPAGNACVILLQENGLLYNLSDQRRIGADLKLPGEYSNISYTDNVAWSPKGGDFYLNDGNAIHEFSGETGHHLRELNAHHRYDSNDQRPELEHVALSPDGRWLCSSDTLGKTVTSLIGRTPPLLKSMESESHRIGGLRISENDDITTWNPPAFPQGK